MKKLILSVAFCLFAAFTFAQDATSFEGKSFGEGVKKGKSELYKHIKQKNGKIFLNGNDSVLMELSNDLDKIYYGENSDFDVHGKSFLNSEFVEYTTPSLLFQSFWLI